MMPSKKDRNRNKNANANMNDETKVSPDFSGQTKAQAKKNDDYRSRY
jgi:hypothetical protein